MADLPRGSHRDACGGRAEGRCIGPFGAVMDSWNACGPIEVMMQHSVPGGWEKLECPDDHTTTRR